MRAPPGPSAPQRRALRLGAAVRVAKWGSIAGRREGARRPPNRGHNPCTSRGPRGEHGPGVGGGRALGRVWVGGPGCADRRGERGEGAIGDWARGSRRRCGDATPPWSR